MELREKTIAFLGDSITAGHGVSDRDHTFSALIARDTGAKCLNYGIGGTRITPQIHTPSPCPEHDRDFLSRVDDLDPTADIVVVFGGTNDYGHGDAPFGAPSDREPTSFYGALHTLYRRLIEKYPDGHIVVLTPLHRLGEDNNTAINVYGNRRDHTLAEYVDAIREVAAYYALPVCDLNRMGEFQPAVSVWQERFMPDGLHPNDAGHIRLARTIRCFLEHNL